MGGRGFMLDAYQENCKIYMEHGDAGKPFEVDYKHEVEDVVRWLKQNPYELLVVQLEDYASDKCENEVVGPWGNTLIDMSAFDSNKRLSEYLEKGKQVILVTDKSSSTIKNTAEVISENTYEWPGIAMNSPKLNQRRDAGANGISLMNYFCCNGVGEMIS